MQRRSDPPFQSQLPVALVFTGFRPSRSGFPLYIYLSKLLPLIVLPPGLVLLLGVVALVMRAIGWSKPAIVLLALDLGLLWVCSMPFTAHVLYGSLESRYPPVPVKALPDSQCAVLLGGAVGAPADPRVDIEFLEATDRVYRTAQLYRAGKAIRVFVTAGNQPWSPAGPSEASLIGELLVGWGVPADAIRLEGSSRNTRENALNVKPLLEQAGCDRSLLVTSAAHMPRARAAFDAVGVSVYPVSTDVRIVENAGLTVMDFLPNAQALAMTSDAMREWLGRLVYELKGWN